MFTHRLLTEGFREDEVNELISRARFNEKSAWNLFLLLITLLNALVFVLLATEYASVRRG